MFSQKGGDLVESKISLTEKTEIFLDFLAERGGGGLTQSKRVLAENWAKYPKNHIFFGYFAQNWVFFGYFFVKEGGGGGGLAQSKISLTEKFWVSKLIGGRGGSRSFGKC